MAHGRETGPLQRRVLRFEGKQLEVRLNVSRLNACRDQPTRPSTLWASSPNANSQYNSARYLKGMAAFEKILLHSINRCPTLWLKATVFGTSGPGPPGTLASHTTTRTLTKI